MGSGLGACVAERGTWRVSDEADKADEAVSLSENFCELLLNLVVLRVRAVRAGKANIQKRGCAKKFYLCEGRLQNAPTLHSLKTIDYQ